LKKTEFFLRVYSNFYLIAIFPQISWEKKRVKKVYWIKINKKLIKLSKALTKTKQQKVYTNFFYDSNFSAKKKQTNKLSIK
jgi:hypothetical protein